MINGSKHVKSAEDVPFGVLSKNFYPHPYWPPNSRNFALQKQFFTQNTYKSEVPPKFVF